MEMLSLRFLSIIALTLAGSSLANDQSIALPIKVSIGIGSYCGGTVISDTQIIVPAFCVMSTYSIDVRVRHPGISVHDSGDIYRIDRMVFHPNRTAMDMGTEYAIVTLNRRIERGWCFRAARLARADVNIPEGEIVTTVRVSNELPSISYYWSELEHYDVKVINSSLCEEKFDSAWSDDFICVGPIDPDAPYPNNQCNGNNGGPLTWNGEIVAINTCELACYGDVCAYRKISSLREFIDENIGN